MREIAEFIDEKVPDGVELTVASNSDHWKLNVSYDVKHNYRSMGTTFPRMKVNSTDPSSENT